MRSPLAGQGAMMLFSRETLMPSGPRKPGQGPPRAAKLMQPGERSLHEPAQDAQPAAVSRVPGGQDRGDPRQAQQLPQRPRVVAPVPLQALGLLPLGAWFAADGGHADQD